MRVIGIVGEPAAGKSTLMRGLLAGLGPGVPERFGLLRGRAFPQERLFILGEYHDSPYPGTDVYDQRARAYAALLFRDGHEWLAPETTILWEGLLFAEPELLAPSGGHELLLIWLHARSRVIAARWAERGGARPDWAPLLGARLEAWSRHARVLRWPSETEAEARANLARLRAILGLATVAEHDGARPQPPRDETDHHRGP